jgi:hypothetical protein
MSGRRWHRLRHGLDTSNGKRYGSCGGSRINGPLYRRSVEALEAQTMRGHTERSIGCEQTEQAGCDFDDEARRPRYTFQCASDHMPASNSQPSGHKTAQLALLTVVTGDRTDPFGLLLSTSRSGLFAKQPLPIDALPSQYDMDFFQVLPCHSAIERVLFEPPRFRRALGRVLCQLFIPPMTSSVGEEGYSEPECSPGHCDKHALQHGHLIVGVRRPARTGGEVGNGRWIICRVFETKMAREMGRLPRPFELHCMVRAVGRKCGEGLAHLKGGYF